MLPQKPLTVIVPVVTRTSELKEDRVHTLLGTAFLVGDGIFMSAKHVFGVTPPSGQELSVIWQDGSLLKAYPIEIKLVDPMRDIAIAHAPDWPEMKPLSLASTDHLVMNSNVLTIEYSPTRSNVPLPSGQPSMDIAANWQKGYVMRAHTADFGHETTTSCLNLSYPALKGASGAPVIEEASGYVLGMIVANVEQQLMPAQIERTIRTDGTRDEVVRYFLPSAQAIHARHLREALSLI